MSYINIAIDGPSGAGKSSLAKALAKELGYIYVDTGALYRSIGLFTRRRNADPYDANKVAPLLDKISLKLEFSNGMQKVIMNGEDVTELLRTPEMSEYASAVSAHKAVRSFLLDTQRNIAKINNVIMDGRDIATVILPNADVKIFLTANNHTRALRRYEELKPKHPELTFEKVLEDIVSRDKNDSSREIAPAVKAEDAILLDNSDLDFEGTVRAALEIIENSQNH